MDKCQKELLDLLNKYCKNKSVIEFGLLNGYVTEVILETNPKHLTCVEPDPMMIHELSGFKVLEGFCGHRDFKVFKRSIR